MVPALMVDVPLLVLRAPVEHDAANSKAALERLHAEAEKALPDSDPEVHECNALDVCWWIRGILDCDYTTG